MMTKVSAQASSSEVVARWTMFWKLFRAKKFLPVKEKTAVLSRRNSSAQFLARKETADARGRPAPEMTVMSPMRRTLFLPEDSTAHPPREQ